MPSIVIFDIILSHKGFKYSLLLISELSEGITFNFSSIEISVVYNETVALMIQDSL